MVEQRLARPQVRRRGLGRSAVLGRGPDSDVDQLARQVADWDAVAEILADLHLDSVTIAGGLIHDVVEDTPATLDDIPQTFGEEPARIVGLSPSAVEFVYAAGAEVIGRVDSATYPPEVEDDGGHRTHVSSMLRGERPQRA